MCLGRPFGVVTTPGFEATDGRDALKSGIDVTNVLLVIRGTIGFVGIENHRI